MARTLVATAVFTIFWVLLSWHFEPLILTCGALAIAVTVLVANRLHVLDEEGAPFEINLRLVLYIPWLIREVVLANLAIAKVILSPRIRIQPHLIRVPTSQRTALGQVIHANTITITPGTISLDVRDGVILVHALTEDAATQDNSGDIDRMISWLEGTRSSPRRSQEESTP